MGFPILVRWHLHIESGPRSTFNRAVDIFQATRMNKETDCTIDFLINHSVSSFKTIELVGHQVRQMNGFCCSKATVEYHINTTRYYTYIYIYIAETMIAEVVMKHVGVEILRDHELRDVVLSTKADNFLYNKYIFANLQIRIYLFSSRCKPTSFNCVWSL